MPTYDDEGSSICSLCGEIVTLNDPLHFSISESSVLCHPCATRSGGAYDPATGTLEGPARAPGGNGAGSRSGLTERCTAR